MRGTPVLSGVDRLHMVDGRLKGRRVGLMTNPTGVDHQLNSTIDLIHSRYRLTALFAVEHGIRGDAQAGAKVENTVDAATGVTVYSAYGKNNRFNQEMLDAFDVLVFDIQDVGARFYTYLYSLAYAMEACARGGKEMVVLDRVNPLGGLKRTGTSIDLYTYNSGSDAATVNALLKRSELKDMDIIFGPLYQQQIKPLADFADRNDIRLVIPFTSKDNTVFRNPSVYQINTPQSYFYSEVYDHFTRQFPNANVVFIEATQGSKDKAEFIKGLKDELRDRRIAFKSLKEDATPESLAATLVPGKSNIFIPTSGSNLTLIKILPQLTLLVRNQPEHEIHLFGYPEWQTYTKDHLDTFFELDTYFYSSFYTNNLLPAAINFTRSYRRWYRKDMEERYPKYGMLGFDTGFFFLKGLSRFGTDLENNLDKMNLTPIQTGFKFQRVNNWGGFVNKKVFFVRFTKNYELVKLDFD